MENKTLIALEAIVRKANPETETIVEGHIFVEADITEDGNQPKIRKYSLQLHHVLRAIAQKEGDNKYAIDPNGYFFPYGHIHRDGETIMHYNLLLPLHEQTPETIAWIYELVK